MAARSGSADELLLAVRTNRRFFSEVYDDLGMLLFEPLVRYRPRRKHQILYQSSLGDLEPRLLESYEASDDGYRYTLRVRPNIVSAFGNELTAEDVKWSFSRALLLRRQGRFTLRIAPIRNENSVTVLDKHTLTVELEKPNVTFPHFLTSKYVPIMDSTEVKRHATADDPWATKWCEGNTAGFGGFVVETYDRDRDRVVYQANDRYFDRRRSGLRRIELRGVADPAERCTLLRRGEVDGATSLLADDFVAFGGDRSFKTYQLPGHDPLVLQMNVTREPLSRLNVRQALSFAIPYDEIFNDIWRGFARRMRSPFVDTALGYTEEYFSYSTDYDRARALLAVERLPKPPVLVLRFFGDMSPRIGETATALKRSFERVGVGVDLQNVSEREVREAGFNHDFDLLLDPHVHMVIDGYYNSICDYGDAKWGIENLNQYFNPDVIKLQSDCLFARTEEERVAFVKEMQRRILADAPQGYLLNINTLMATSAAVTGLAWDANGRLYYQDVSKAGGSG